MIAECSWFCCIIYYADDFIVKAKLKQAQRRRIMQLDDFEVERKIPKGRSFPGLSDSEEGLWNGPFCFIQSADPQFGLIDGWNGVPKDEVKWDQEIALTNKAFESINKLKPRPKFVSICGDLVDAAPGTRIHDLQTIDLKKMLMRDGSAI